MKLTDDRRQQFYAFHTRVYGYAERTVIRLQGKTADSVTATIGQNAVSYIDRGASAIGSELRSHAKVAMLLTFQWRP